MGRPGESRHQTDYAREPLHVGGYSRPSKPMADTGWRQRVTDRFPILHKKRGKFLLALLDDTYFYGQSEPVYPSPQMPGSGTWKGALDKAKQFVAKLTVDEKAALVSGDESSTGSSGVLNGCSGNIRAIPRLNFTGLCLSDAGQGVRATDFVSGFPSEVHVGASWNKPLARRRAESLGLEFRVKGVNVALGPVVGPVGRVATGGRNWENFGSDPYLTGVLAAETVQGIQAQGVITSTKHFIANEQETHRNPNGDGVAAISSNIDDRTMHELYLWPFQDALRAGAACIMCSYNRVNNSYGCQNSKTQNGLLKTELGFEGFVVSDWGAVHGGVPVANAGMDMLVVAVKNGSLEEARLDDMADRDFPEPGIGMPADLTKPHRIVDARNISSRKVLFDGAVEGHVLLKNTKGALPLKKPKVLSIFGYSAKSPDQWNYKSNGGVAAWTFGGESSYLGRDTQLGFSNVVGKDWSQIAPNGTIFSGGGSGAVTPASVSSPFEALSARAYDDGTALFWDFFSPDPDVYVDSDACLVLGNAYASEGYDRTGLFDKYTDGLIRHVADRCNNTIVIFHNTGARLVEEWIDHANVTALIYAHLPGEASGRALVSLLYGDSNFSGKLPFTVAKKESDYEQLLAADLPKGIFAQFPQSNFTEGSLIDYRHFDAKDITPRFEFGYGLSYTRFNYSNLQVSSRDNASKDEFPSGPVQEGGQIDLWDIVATVSADVKNVGSVDGAEAAQLYLGIPGDGSPVRQLRGFDKPSINATQSATVRFELTRRDLSVWDVVAQKWRLQAGEYQVFVGASSRDLPLRGVLNVKRN
ncbi:glycosyl hydrolase family 3 N terminal domain-domain-containing protein [Microdochium bolleyi]|uniref:beta-glucosidase n=1 Tax=Microdochium bolleyi TaxID=196109 RepID=A0A136J157_9PEZI|nr:glycosyl hydrolase family 3 N terminal domain-domain-containing protein [Microdochium bolleyi]